MDRCEQAVGYHKKGFNCCQSVLAAFQDVIGLTETQCLTLGGGFGAGEALHGEPGRAGAPASYAAL